MAQQLIVERRNKNVSRVLSSINRIIVRNGENKQGCLNDLSEIMGSVHGIYLGAGGSHIWACNSKKERIFIITGY